MGGKEGVLQRFDRATKAMPSGLIVTPGVAELRELLFTCTLMCCLIGLPNCAALSTQAS